MRYANYVNKLLPQTTKSILCVWLQSAVSNKWSLIIRVWLTIYSSIHLRSAAQLALQEKRTSHCTLTLVIADGSWFLPNQSIYPAVTATVQLQTCDRFPSSTALRSNRSSPYPSIQQRPKSTSVSPPPHGKLFTLSNTIDFKNGPPWGLSFIP